MKHIVMVAAMVFLSEAPSSFGKSIEVPADTTSIQAAINLATDGDTVLVAEGRYFENILMENKSIVLASHFIVDGDTGHISRTIIDGSRPVDAGRATAITVSGCRDTTTVLCGFTVTGGFGTRVPNGTGGYCRVAGGISVEGSSAAILDNRVVGNTISPTVVPDTYIEATAAGIGANTFDVEGTMLIVRNNLIADNRLEGNFTAGAGMAYLSDFVAVTASFIVEGNTIRDNINQDRGSWKGMGGGLVISVVFPTSGIKIVRNNLVTGNKVLGYRSFGGGMYFVYGDSPEGVADDDIGELVYNNILDGNHAEHRGGAISVWRFATYPGTLQSRGKYRPRPVFINNTIVNNTAGDGSGFFIMNHVPFVMNSILWNEPQGIREWGEIFLGDVPEWRDANLYGDCRVHSSDIRGGWGDGEGNIDLDPLLDSTYRLSEISPCISAGMDSLQEAGTWHRAPSACFFGGSRPNPAATKPDLGACESPLATGVRAQEEQLPAVFNLRQNYPNPFNPITTIIYELPTSSDVRLSVFDVLGREVAVLVDQRREAGVHKATFVGAGCASGLYFCRLTAGSASLARMMLLVR